MLVCLCTALATLQPAADDPVFSGPQPGETLVPFVVTGTIGDEAGKKLDFVTRAAGKPCVLIFVHERTRPAFGLANLVMRLVASRSPDKLTGALVFLTNDPTDTANWMGKVKNYFPKGIGVGISPDGLEGPGAYGLNRNVAVTVLVAKDRKVTANFALVQPSNQVDGPKIFKAIADVLGEKDVPNIADFSGPAGRDQRMQKNAKRPAMAKQPDPKIRQLMRPLINAETDEQIDAAAKLVEDYAAQNAKAKQEIGEIARRIIRADKLKNYGTAHCQQYLKKWAKEFQTGTSDKPTEPRSPKD